MLKVQVVDRFLKFGYVMVSYEEDLDSLTYLTNKRRKGAAGSSAAPANLIPIVPPTDTYEVAYIMAGRAGYHRRYLVYAKASLPALSHTRRRNAYAA